MAGLLDFVAGFGVGALGGLAEQKKANLEQKRQLNLAKLKAEYAADIETKQKEREIERRKQLMDAGDYRGAIIAGETEVAKALKPKEPSEIEAADLVNVIGRDGAVKTVNIKTPGILGQIESGELVRVATQKPSERFIERTDPDGTPILIDTQTDLEYARVGRNWQLITKGGRQTFEDQKPELDILLLEEDRPGRAEDLITGRATETGTGAESAVRRGASRIPLIGEVLEQYTGGFAQEQAESSQFISRLNNQLRAEAARTLQPDGRLQTMVLELVKNVEIPQGILTTPTSTANQFRAVRKEMVREYELAQNRAVNLNLSADERMQARNYIERFRPIINDVSLVILSHDAGKINVRYDGQTLKLNELSFSDLQQLSQNWSEGKLELNEPQRNMIANLLEAYQYYNQ